MKNKPEEQSIPQENAELIEQVKSVPAPIFIGTDDGMLIQKIDAIVNSHNAEKNSNYEVALLSPNMYNANARLYFMHKMSEDQRSSLQKQEKEKEMLQEQITLLIRLKDYMVKKNNKTQEEIDEILYSGMSYKEWKENINGQAGANISNKDMEDILNLLSSSNFAVCVNPDQILSKRIYKIIKDDVNLLDELNKRLSREEDKKNIIEKEMNFLNIKIAEVSEKLLNSDEVSIPILDNKIDTKEFAEESFPEETKIDEEFGQHKTGNPVIDIMSRAGENVDVQHLKSPIISTEDAEAIEFLDKVTGKKNKKA